MHDALGAARAESPLSQARARPSAIHRSRAQGAARRSLLKRGGKSIDSIASLEIEPTCAVADPRIEVIPRFQVSPTRQLVLAGSGDVPEP
jgi:hypothetical protein